MARWQALGVRREVIRQTGSIKYDPIEADAAAQIASEVLQSIGVSASRAILLAGSTHDGEEEIVARTFLQLRNELPGLFAIIAPRHVERAAEIVRMLESLGLRVQRRTEVSSVADKSIDILLLDTTGELRQWYGIATVVFVGKSLTTVGGQNPVEPILAGKPVIFGPHMENFATLSRMLVEHDAAVQLSDADQLFAAFRALLNDASRRETLVRRAREVVDVHRGATQRTAELVMGGLASDHAKSLARQRATSDIANLS